MARASLSNELKQAIKDLDHKEKDKLLLRLIPKDDLLVEQLTFRLLENSSTQEERREVVKNEIEEAKNYSASNSYGYSPALLQWSVRKKSGMITRHVRVTKDKYGAIELNLLLLKMTLKLSDPNLKFLSNRKSVKLREYIVKKLISVRKSSMSIHEDYLLDFEEHLYAIGAYMNNDPLLLQISQRFDFDVDALNQGRLS